MEAHTICEVVDGCVVFHIQYPIDDETMAMIARMIMMVLSLGCLYNLPHHTQWLVFCLECLLQCGQAFISYISILAKAMLYML